jgi:hypothetical protein
MKERYNEHLIHQETSEDELNQIEGRSSHSTAPRKIGDTTFTSGFFEGITFKQLREALKRPSLENRSFTRYMDAYDNAD